MSMEIIEVLANAEHNLKNTTQPIFIRIEGLEQLHNVIVLLEKGYDPYDNFNEIMDGHESVDSVKEKDD